MQNTLSVHNRDKNPNFSHQSHLAEENVHQLLSSNIEQMTKLAQQVALSKQQQNATRYSFDNFGIRNVTQYELCQLFGHIEFIVICGERSRAEKIAMQCYESLKIKEFPKIVKNNNDLKRQILNKRAQSSRNLFDQQHSHHFLRDNHNNSNKNKSSHSNNDNDIFTMYRIGQILCCNHGMGAQSISMFLNDLLRIMKLAKNHGYSVLRLGSAGGIGVCGGTMVVSTNVLDPLTLKPEWKFHSCGIENHLECIFNENINNKLFAIGKAKKYLIEKGKTVATECYYEGQARLDGAICEYNDNNKMEYLKYLHKIGVRNFEMEGLVMSAMLTRHQIPCAMLCVAYLDRLKEDTVPEKYSKEEVSSWMEHAIDVVIQYIYQFVLNKDSSNNNNKNGNSESKSEE